MVTWYKMLWIGIWRLEDRIPLSKYQKCANNFLFWEGHPSSLWSSVLQRCCGMHNRCSHLIVTWQRLLTVGMLLLHALTFYLHSLRCWTQLSTNNSQDGGWSFHTNLLVFSPQPEFQLITHWVAPTDFKMTPRYGPHKKEPRFHYCSVTSVAALQLLS
jgi:hypothetical protein